MLNTHFVCVKCPVFEVMVPLSPCMLMYSALWKRCSIETFSAAVSVLYGGFGWSQLDFSCLVQSGKTSWSSTSSNVKPSSSSSNITVKVDLHSESMWPAGWGIVFYFIVSSYNLHLKKDCYGYLFVYAYNVLQVDLSSVIKMCVFVSFCLVLI